MNRQPLGAAPRASLPRRRRRRTCSPNSSTRARGRKKRDSNVPRRKRETTSPTCHRPCADRTPASEGGGAEGEGGGGGGLQRIIGAEADLNMFTLERDARQRRIVSLCSSKRKEETRFERTTSEARDHFSHVPAAHHWRRSRLEHVYARTGRAGWSEGFGRRGRPVGAESERLLPELDGNAKDGSSVYARARGRKKRDSNLGAAPRASLPRRRRRRTCSPNSSTRRQRARLAS
jgi:hypothetical protein